MLIESLVKALAGRLIVSCQAPEGDPFRESASIARFAKAAERGGAAALRVNGPSDVEAVRRVTGLPVFGIQKRVQRDGKALITPTFEDANALVIAGASVLAVECTARAQRYGALDLIRRIRTGLRVPVMADIATLEEALAAEEAGADLVASTMRGYTDETQSIRVFEPAFIAALASRLRVPILAEGRVNSPEQALEALEAGAMAVIVGTAITRPEKITARFVEALRRKAVEPGAVIGIDVGGTNTKAGVIDRQGALRNEWTAPTPTEGREVLLRHLVQVARRALDESDRNGIQVEAIGVATAGWVDPNTGRVVHATENLPGWTGTPVADELANTLALPVAVENDANAQAFAERHFGAGRGVDDFVCLTLGTGVGGGCFTGGRLLRGAHFLGNAIGHIVIDRNGEPCSCGQRGCLESFANAAALVRYGGGKFTSAEEVILAAHSGDAGARSSLRKYAEYLAVGIASVAHLLDPALIILAGGIAEKNRILFADLTELLSRTTMAANIRSLQIVPSPLGYYGAVYGAGAVARRKLWRCFLKT